MTSSASQPYDVDWKYIKKVDRVITASDFLKEKIDAIPEVVDNTHDRSSDKALSANQWRLLQDQIDELKTPWKFLSNWDSATWLATTSLQDDPYVYWNWDYFIVSNISQTTNYKPTGMMYTDWSASTEVETDTVNIDDMYMYNGNDWVHTPAWMRQIAVDAALSTTSTNPVENRVITQALEDVVTFKPFPASFDTDWTTEEFLLSIEDLHLHVWSAYLWQVSLSDMPEWVSVQWDVEVYVYPQNVIYAIMRSAEIPPYEWVVDSYSNSYYSRWWTPGSNLYTWSSAPTSSATEWMLRYDTVNDILKSFDWTEWKVVWWTEYTAWKWITIDSNTITNQYSDPYRVFNNCYNKKDPNHRLRILCFWSSWFECTWLYLNKILDNLNIKAELHCYYLWHSQFNEWLKLYNWDLSPVNESGRWMWQYISVDWSDWTISWVNLTNNSTHPSTTITKQEYAQRWLDDLTTQKWDLIIVQQWAHQACNPVYWTNQEDFVRMIKQYATTDTVIWFNSTWAPWTNWTWNSVDTAYLPTPATDDVSWQHVFLSEHLDRVKEFMMKTWIENISPTWLTFQLAREDATINLVPAQDLTRDKLHPTNGRPMFICAATLYQSIIAPMTWIPMKNCTWRPTTSSYRTTFSNSYYEAISENQAYTILNYIDAAIARRFDILPSTKVIDKWTAAVDAWVGWTATLSSTSWEYVLWWVTNTLTITPAYQHKISEIRHNWKKVTVVDWVNVYPLTMTYWYNLIEVDFERVYQSSPSVYYTVTANITNWSITSQSQTIEEWWTAAIAFESNLWYSNPDSVTVVWAQYEYNKATWIITLSDATQDVTVTIACQAARNITSTITNWTLVNNPATISDTATITFEPTQPAYTYPTTVSVSGASYTYDNTTWIIVLSDPTSDVTVSIDCPILEHELNTPIAISATNDVFTDWTDRHWVTITATRYLLSYRPAANNRAWTWKKITSWNWNTEDRNRAILYLEPWKTITIHASSDHRYTVAMSKIPAIIARLPNNPSIQFWEASYRLWEYDVYTCLDWTDRITTSAKADNPYANVSTMEDYFPYTSSNDYVYSNTTNDVLYIWVWFAKSANFEINTISATYTITNNPQSRSITTTIQNWTLITNPTVILDWSTATIQFSPDYLAWDYPNSVSVSWASYTYDNTTGTIVLSNATENVTVWISCPEKTVVENTPIAIPTTNLRQDITSTITNARFSFWYKAATTTRATVAAPSSEDLTPTWEGIRVKAALFVPSGKKMTVHMNSTHKYLWFAARHYYNWQNPWTWTTRPSWYSYYYWKSVFQINDNLTSVNSTVFDWTDDYYNWTINPNPQSASTFDWYFTHTSSNDWEVSNTTSAPLFVWLICAWDTTSTTVDKSAIDLQYTYSSLSN